MLCFVSFQSSLTDGALVFEQAQMGNSSWCAFDFDKNRVGQVLGMPSIWSVPDGAYSRNTLRALHLISTFLFDKPEMDNSSCPDFYFDKAQIDNSSWCALDFDQVEMDNSS